MNELGENIRRRREELKMTQTDLAAKLGYADKSAINKIENGTNDLTQSKIKAFAKALDTTVPELMGWEKDEYYYLDDEVREIVQELFDRKELKILFNTTRKVKPEDIKHIQKKADELKEE